MSQNIPYRLRDWIDPKKLEYDALCQNPNAISYMMDLVQEYSVDESGRPLLTVDEILDSRINYPRHIRWFWLSSNPSAVPLLEKHPHKIYWDMISMNPNAMHLIEKKMREQPDRIRWNICWKGLSMNPSAIELLKKNPDRIKWDWLSMNPNAIELLENNLDKVDWFYLSENPGAISILEKNMDKIYWPGFNQNPSAVPFLKKNPDKIIWYWFSINPNPDAIPLLEKNLDKIHKISEEVESNRFSDWVLLSKNPGAISILEKHPQKIFWYYFSMNPGIFTYDYEKMRNSHLDLKEEIIRKALHPKRILKWLESGIDIEDI
jgi:hypothetical protein